MKRGCSNNDPHASFLLERRVESFAAERCASAWHQNAPRQVAGRFNSQSDAASELATLPAQESALECQALTKSW